VFKEKDKQRYLILLGVSLVFTFLIPELIVWDYPRIPRDGLGILIGDFTIASVAIIRAMSLFIIDIVIKVILLFLLFKKEK